MRKTHGKSGTRLYRIWVRMRYEAATYVWDLGNRVLCKEWENDFNAFETWAYAHGYTDTTMLHRHSKKSGFNPENCYWSQSRSTLLSHNRSTATQDSLVNQVFGKLVVLREVPKEMRKPGRRTFVCKCECGNEVNVLAQNLLSGATKSCGCARNRASKITTTDTGNIRAGRLTILERFDDNGVVKYRCLCDCGKMLGVQASDLFSGRVTSCGCSVTQVQQPTPASEPNPLANWDNF